MEKSVKIKNVLNYIKERKFIYLIVALVLVIVWGLIGINVNKATDTESLIIWVTPSYSDETEIEEFYNHFKSDYKKYGFKEVNVFVSDVSSTEDKLSFNLWGTAVDFYVVKKDLIGDNVSRYTDFSTLKLTEYLGEEYLNEKGYKYNDLFYGITLSEDYVFAISSCLSIPDNCFYQIIDFVKNFNFS